MNTLISCAAVIEFPKDDFVFLDLELWKQLEGVSIEDSFNSCLGIKHGVGLCGGRGHNQMDFTHKDENFDFLRSIVDNEAFNFYKSL
jgi:hypothetical protein